MTIPNALGLAAAFVALISWAFGDFFIQRATRRVGNIVALGAIGLLGFLVLTPFVWDELPRFLGSSASLWILVATLGFTTIAALLDFEALRVGKLAVIEPVMSFELPLTVFIGLAFLQEHVSGMQLLFALWVFAGILLTVIRHEPRHWWTWWSKRRVLEHGVILGGIGALMMALTNVFTGLSSQATSPLVTIWFIHTSLAVFCFGIVIIRGDVRATLSNVRRYWKVVLAESVFDNMAWIAYATAVLVLPISITIAITESYVALAAILGLIINRERLQQHQLYGVGLTLVAAIALAVSVS